MNLLFDARYIRTDFHDGISRYTTELGNALAKLHPVTFIISKEAQREFLPPDAATVLLHDVSSPLEPFTALRLNKYRPDVVVSPLQTMGSLGRKFKLILTLHDLIYYKHRLPPPVAKGLVRPLWRLFHLTYWPQRLVLNRADIVATVSQTSKKEILEARLTKRPVIVVSNAARDLTPLLNAPVKQGTSPPRNLIFMGTPLPYKNPETLIRMMAFLPGRTLHILSKISAKRKAELSKLIPADAHVIFHNGVSDEAYAALLADDAIMVSASKAEGFGLPLAEALMLGVPAVVSDLDFFQEVGGEAAVYVDPQDPQGFAAAVSSLDDLAVRSRRIKAGKAHIKTFSWQHSAIVLLKTCTQLTKR
jgi:glycosyltransferase involved in cell wall biosynthesis